MWGGTGNYLSCGYYVFGALQGDAPWDAASVTCTSHLIKGDRWKREPGTFALQLMERLARVCLLSDRSELADLPS